MDQRGKFEWLRPSWKWALPLVPLVAFVFLKKPFQKDLAQNAPAPVASVQTPVALPPVAQLPPPPRPEQKSLGYLGAYEGRVTFRRKEELVWQEAAAGTKFFAFDAIKTHGGAKAKVVLNGGSELELVENTLVIINPNLNWKDRVGDRAVVRAGTLKGRTKKVLWLLTSAALVRVQAPKQGTVAEADLQIQEGKSLKTVLKKGTASVYTRKPSGLLQKGVALLQRKEVKLKAPAMSAVYGTMETDWHLTAAVIPVKIERTIASVNLPPVNLIILSPPNHSRIRGSAILLKGKTTGRGAKIVINGSPANIDEELNFSTRVELTKGQNNVVIRLVQPDGTEVYRQWVLVRTH